MDVVLYKNFSVPNKLSKNITEVARYQGVQLIQSLDRYQGGQAVQAVNDADVSIRMTVPTDDLRWDAVNYFEWDGAYYFLTSVDKQVNSLSILNGEMDLLMTYSDAILQLMVTAERSSSHGSPRLEDSLSQLSVDADRIEIEFPNAPSDQENAGFYVLTTSQAGYTVRPPDEGGGGGSW